MRHSHISTLRRFEALLQPSFEEVGLIGEIPLSDGDEHEIQKALRELLDSTHTKNAAQFLRTDTPCTLAWFLVRKGRYYDAGNYWEEVRRSVGLSPEEH